MGGARDGERGRSWEGVGWIILCIKVTINRFETCVMHMS